MSQPKVLIVGAGIAGLSAALSLARSGVRVTIIEKSAFAGGHAVQYTCKATDRCVKCGACIVEQRLQEVLAHPHIQLKPRSRIMRVEKQNGIRVHIDSRPDFIGPNCNACGDCLAACPAAPAIISGSSAWHHPFYAVDETCCRHFQEGDCQKCQDICPREAIELDKTHFQWTGQADAVLVSSGFSLFDPRSKPYGFGRFDNVITNLELERMLRRQDVVTRPSDGRAPAKMAFIQCVGSRDSKRNHLWCSKTCCATALRTAMLIKQRQPRTEITFFYIDVQRFGKAFEETYPKAMAAVTPIRAIPGDCFQTEDAGLKTTYFEGGKQAQQEAVFDLLVLSAGVIPGEDGQALARQFGLACNDAGFITQGPADASNPLPGVFAAGACLAPKSIAESISEALGAAEDILSYLSK